MSGAVKQLGIVTEGSSRLGFGHLRRTATLAAALRGEVAIRFFVLGPPESYPRAALELLLKGFDWCFVDAEDHAIEASAADGWVLDIADRTQTRFLQRYPAVLERCVALDWFIADALPAVTVNLLDHDGSMREAYVHASTVHRFHEGPSFALIRSALRNLPIRPPDASAPPRLLLTFGGADPARCTHRALTALDACAERLAAVTVVLGPLFEPTSNDRELVLRGVPFECISDPRDFPRRLHEADVVLCGGGSTLLESLSLGRPTVVYPQSEAERAHAATHVDVGACVWAERLTEVIDDTALRARLSAAAYRRVDGRGLERITTLVHEMLA